MITRMEASLEKLQTKKKFKSARLSGWEERLNDVESFLEQLRDLRLDNLPGTLPPTPWHNQDTSVTIRIINDCKDTQHTKGDWDINILQKISVVGEYFSGTNSSGYPSAHEDILAEGGQPSKQKLLQMKMIELNVLVVLVYKWLVDHHRVLFESYIPKEWENEQDGHPALNDENLLSVIETMKESVHFFSSINGVYSPQYLPIFLQNQSDRTSIVEDECNVTAEQLVWSNESVLEMIDWQWVKQQYKDVIDAVSLIVLRIYIAN